MGEPPQVAAPVLVARHSHRLLFNDLMTRLFALDLMTRLFALAKGNGVGVNRCTLLLGPPGIGKTMLLNTIFLDLIHAMQLNPTLPRLDIVCFVESRRPEFHHYDSAGNLTIYEDFPRRLNKLTTVFMYDPNKGYNMERT